MGALNGIRVVDFGQYVAGPLTAMLLADQGADVVRIDPPGGPRFDTPGNSTWNRGKRSILLDLKRPDEFAIALRLVERADVLVENFRPGVMDRLGLGYEAMRSTNPRLVYCSLPGFASDDPRAGVQAWEGVVGAATRSYPLNPETGAPVYTALPISSCYAAFQGAVSIAMALFARARNGMGQRIEVPLFDATFGAMGNRVLRVHGRPPEPPAPIPSNWTRQFECKDGGWIQFQAGNLNFEAFAEAVGAADWAAGRDAMPRILDLFRTRTAQEWENFCETVGTECAVCRTSGEWLEHPHARATGIIIKTHDPKLGDLVQPGINVRLTATPGTVRWPAPAADAHRAEVLAELDSPSPPERRAAFEPLVRAALEGVKVLDLCIILAGPTCGRTLAEFGADVIKIDGPRRGVASHNDVNRGKRSVVLDLKNKQGLDLFWHLVDGADVVVQNFRKGVAERLGIGYEQVRARRPDIVYASLNCYGQLGPWAGRPGHEQLAQASTGMQRRFGGNGRPVLQPFPINDYGTGFMGAYGVALALLHRRRTGQGQHVDTALAYTATILQSQFLQSYEGKRWDEPSGQDTLGSSPGHRAYQAKDGWFFLGAGRDGTRQLERIPGLSRVAGLTAAGLERALEETFQQGTVVEWVNRLVAAGIGAHRVVEDLTELTTDPWVRAHGLIVTREHEGFGLIDTTGPAPRLSRTPVAPGRPAARPGSDAPSVLAEIGLDGELERFVRDRIVFVDGIAVR